MSRMRAIAAALLASPGMSVEAIAKAINQDSPAVRNSIAAALCTMAQSGRVRHNNQPARSGRRLWYATPEALEDRRLVAHRRGKPLTAKQAAAARARQAARKPAPPARAAAPKPPKPPRSAAMTIVRKPLAVPKTRFAPTAEPETVAQWMARTGQQPERLAPHACGKPVLRFDHSDNTVPTGRRRPALRVRGSHRV